VLQLIARFGWVNKIAARIADGRVAGARRLHRSALFAQRFQAVGLTICSPPSRALLRDVDVSCVVSVGGFAHYLSQTSAAAGATLGTAPCVSLLRVALTLFVGRRARNRVFPYGCNKLGSGKSQPTRVLRSADAQ
jgi:hypothetical protein